jgi:hypothetical protein
MPVVGPGRPPAPYACRDSEGLKEAAPRWRVVVRKSRFTDASLYPEARPNLLFETFWKSFTSNIPLKKLCAPLG